jgi:hypothetical protein
MGFTLGQKEYIINSSAQMPIEVIGTKIRVKGYGTFEPTQMVPMGLGQRFVPETFSELTIVPVDASAMGVTTVGTPASFKISISTSRMAAEWGNNYIINSRPFIFELLLNPTDDAAAVASKLAAAMTAHESVFGALPFTHTAGTGNVTIVAKESHLAISPRVTVTLPFADAPYILESTNSFFSLTGITGTLASGVVTVTAGGGYNLKVGDKIRFNDAGQPTTFVADITRDTSGVIMTFSITSTIAPGPVSEVLVRRNTGEEPTVDGKYLEENVRMSLPATSDVYAINAGQGPVLKGGYTQVTFTMKDTWTDGGVDGDYRMHRGLGGTRDESAGERLHTFTLYFLEGGGGLWGDAGAIFNLLTTLDETDGSVAPVKFDLKMRNLSVPDSISEFCNPAV